MAHNQRKRAVEKFDPLASTQEPYLQLTAPNLDKISRSSFRRGSVSRRRIFRALVVFGIVLVLIVVVAVISGVLATMK